MFGLEATLGRILGKLALYGGIILAGLLAWWAKGKSGERKGLQRATEAADKKERRALEEIIRQRDAPAPGPFGGGLPGNLEEPGGKPAGPAEGGSPES